MLSKCQNEKIDSFSEKELKLEFVKMVNQIKPFPHFVLDNPD